MKHLDMVAELLPLVLVLVLALGLFAAYGVRLVFVGRARDARLQHEHPTLLLGRFPMEAFHWAMRLTASGFMRLGVTPDQLTYLSLLTTAVAVPLIATGAFAWGAFAMLVGSACDALDGIVARRQGVASDAGEVLDAVADRYADALPLIGLLFYFHESRFALAAVVLAWQGSFAVSYVRAKAEAMGVAPKGGLMRRQERLLYVGIGLLLGPVLPMWNLLPVHRPLTLGVLGFVGLLSNVAAIQLTRQTRELLIQKGP